MDRKPLQFTLKRLMLAVACLAIAFASASEAWYHLSHQNIDGWYPGDPPPHPWRFFLNAYLCISAGGLASAVSVLAGWKIRWIVLATGIAVTLFACEGLGLFRST